MRLIDADALLEDVRKHSESYFADDFAEYWVDRQPTITPSAQPEIIRCKECKWFGNIGCAIEIADDSDRPSENDYCSFAERRTAG